MKLNIKRYWIVLVVLLVILIAIVSGCGSSTSGKKVSGKGGTLSSTVSNNIDSPSLVPKDANKTEYDKTVTEQITVTLSDTSQANIGIKKIVKNANVSMKVVKIDEAFLEISEWVKNNGGYEFSRNESVIDKYKNIYIVFKIPPEKLSTFIDFLKKTGKVLNSTISGEDITDQYYDSAARLDNLIKGREQLLEIQKKAVTITDLLKVQNELNNITGKIESLQGRIKMWDKMVAESTVYVSIDEEANPLKPSTEINWKFSSLSDVWNTMKNYFILVTNTVVTALTWAIIIVISILPLAVIVFGIVMLIRCIGKRKKKKLTK